MEHVFQILIAIDVTWLVARLLDSVVNNVILHLDERTDGSMVAQFGPILQKTLRSLVWILGIISGLTNAGYDVGALLAGVGIGGLAMAMAAKDFVANIFGGITVFIDKPFGAGDRIKVNGIDGTVQEIGIRSTRIKTLENRLVTIPNNQFTDKVVENVTAEPSRKMTVVLGDHDTTPEQIEQALQILTDIVSEAGRTENEYTVWFSGFGDFSLNVSAIYFIRKGSTGPTFPTRSTWRFFAASMPRDWTSRSRRRPSSTRACPKRDIVVMGGRCILVRQHLDHMNEYDVIIHMNEPRKYWALLLGSFACGLALIRRFQRLEGNVLERALNQMGWVSDCPADRLPDLHGRRPRIPLDCAPLPASSLLRHQHLACGAQLLLAQPHGLSLFTAFMGTIGGFHAILTPQLTVGMPWPILPSLLHQPRCADFCAHRDDATVQDAFPQMGVDLRLLHRRRCEHHHGRDQPCVERVGSRRGSGQLHVHDGTAQGRQSLCVFRDLAWPWYVFPLHAAMILHLLILNPLYRWRFPAFGPQANADAEGQASTPKLSLFQ